MEEQPTHADLSDLPETPPVYEGTASEAFCWDCDEIYNGPRDECFKWLEKHRSETGHNC